MFQCTNLAVQWDPTVKGTCWQTFTIQALSYTNVACNITTDLLFAIVIPIPMLWHVQLNRRQKISIIGILGLGVFVTAASVVKASFLPNYGRTGDWLWDSRNSMLQHPNFTPVSPTSVLFPAPECYILTLNSHHLDSPRV